MNLKGRHLLTLLDYSSEEITYLLNLSATLKANKRAGSEIPRLKGKNIVLIFEKTSTRTRISFEIAALDQGAHVTYLDTATSQIGHKETIEDTARVLGALYDGIEFRGSEQKTVEILAQYAGVPVWNGLTSNFHPTQALADILTIQENIDIPLKQVVLCYIGNTDDNVSNSLMVIGAKLGMEVRLCGPEAFQPDQNLLKKCQEIAKHNGGTITFSTDPIQAVTGAHFIYTDVWVSLGEPEEAWEKSIPVLKPYQVNKELMAVTGNINTKFLHCLPAFHNNQTKVGKAICSKFNLDAMEVTDDVFESRASIVFEQAENRMHTIKAVMVATLT